MKDEKLVRRGVMRGSYTHKWSFTPYRDTRAHPWRTAYIKLYKYYQYRTYRQHHRADDGRDSDTGPAEILIFIARYLNDRTTCCTALTTI